MHVCYAQTDSVHVTVVWCLISFTGVVYEQVDLDRFCRRVLFIWRDSELDFFRNS